MRAFRSGGPLIALGTAVVMWFAVAVPASAQFFPFGGFGGGFGRPAPPPGPRPPPQQSPFGNFFTPFEQPRQAPAADYSRAPKAERDTSGAERQVLVLGDAMADWLAYGLEDAFSEQPDMGVIRKHKTVSGLIKYQPRGEPSDWIAAAKTIVPAEKADVIVVMLGLNDRVPIRDVAPAKTDADKKKADAKPATPGAKGDAAKPDAKPGDAKPGDADQAADDQDANDQQVVAPERAARGGNYEFRDDRWIELYNKKIDDMITVLKSKGVPIIWVGLPAVRGPKATSDMLFLDGLYRDAAAKAGISYVDVWDGFVDEGGRFMQQGPDFEGQIRRLRSADGVFFTKPGARKLAHYVDREINRLLVNRGPIALPNEPVTPDVAARPGAPAPRPLAGPIVPLNAASVETDSLLGGPGMRPATIDPLVARTLVKGEPLPQLAGRADDYAWPRREVGRIDAPRDGKDVPVANAAPDGAASDAAKPAPKPKRVAQPPAPVLVTPSPGASTGFLPMFRRPPQQPQVRQPPNAPMRPPGYIGRADGPSLGFFR